MLVDALALLLGARASADMCARAPRAVRRGRVRSGSTRVAGRRRASLRARVGPRGRAPRPAARGVADGRSRAWVNGSPTTIGVLARDRAPAGRPARPARDPDAAARRRISAICSTRSRTRTATRRRVAAAWAASRGSAAEEAALQRSGAKCVAARRLPAARGPGDRRARRIKPGEEEALEMEARRLSQAGSLGELANEVAELVGGDEQSALKALGRADRTLSALEKARSRDGGVARDAGRCFAQLQELARARRATTRADCQDDPARLAEIERRRDLIYRLKQKHGAELSESPCHPRPRRCGIGSARYRRFRPESAARSGVAAERRS